MEKCGEVMQDILFKAVVLYYLGINIILFFSMLIDKQKAIHKKERVPESTLFIMSLLGGSVGGFIGMHLFHHKTRKIYFHIIYWVALALHLALLYVIFTKFIHLK
ncbi:MAG: DUF1294 domain-containing protein [Clostridia bacterium]|nr:DUF1294 domain-containing protein [Clostridia bacterium]MCI1999949.1 DUF1294 domain-containing protein [Clostridia bacterium]MCI2014517.1 DUF1294 domain-containing protein [Clostridia bacterium]